MAYPVRMSPERLAQVEDMTPTGRAGGTAAHAVVHDLLAHVAWLERHHAEQVGEAGADAASWAFLARTWRDQAQELGHALGIALRNINGRPLPSDPTTEQLLAGASVLVASHKRHMDRGDH